MDDGWMVRVFSGSTATRSSNYQQVMLKKALSVICSMDAPPKKVLALGLFYFLVTLSVRSNMQKCLFQQEPSARLVIVVVILKVSKFPFSATEIVLLDRKSVV